MDEYKRKGVDGFEAGDIIKRYEDKYQPIASVIDGGALGGMIAQGINRVFMTNLIKADKQRKYEHIALYNAHLRTGDVVVRRSSFPVIESRKLFWDEEDFAKGVYKEAEGQENDACDAALYGWFWCFSFFAENEPKRIAKGSNEWMDADLERLRNRYTPGIWSDERESFLQGRYEGGSD